jgi:pantothenate kinase
VRFTFLDGIIVFRKFDANKIGDFISYLKNEFFELFTERPKMLYATGGGAFKHAACFKDELCIDIVKEDEMACLIGGLNFLTSHVPFESFYFLDKESIMYDGCGPNEMPRAPHYPCLLVNIGSGVSILKVTNQFEYERISGTSLGGGTYWGLMRLMNSQYCHNFDDALVLANQGDNKTVDLLVGDIYGSDYAKIGLSADVIASSFGKTFHYSSSQCADILSGQQGICDISRSLLYMLSNNIGQIAYLNAKLHHISRIYFSGFFIRGHPITMKTLTYAIRFWSKGTISPFFLRHEGYLGALGCLFSQPHSPMSLREATFELSSKPPALISDRFDPSDSISVQKK